MQITEISVSLGRTVSQNYNSIRSDITVKANNPDGIEDVAASYKELRDMVTEMVDDALEYADQE